MLNTTYYLVSSRMISRARDGIQFFRADNKRIHELELSFLKNIQQNITHPGCNEQAETLLAIFSFEAYVFILNPISFAICYNLLGIWMGKIIKTTKTSYQDYDQ